MNRLSVLADMLGELRREERLADEILHLVPSENVLSPAARSAYAGTLQARYSFGNGEFNAAWPAMDWFEQVERECQQELGALLGVHHVSVRPLSGMNAMTVALAASGAADVLTVAVPDGGHAVTSQMAHSLGARVHPVALDGRGQIDVDATLRTIEPLPGPVLIYLDQYCSVRPLRVAELATALPAGIRLHYDASHIMGLVVGGLVANPIADGADSLGGSLHKSFPGPHRGLLASNDSGIYEDFRTESARWISHHQPGHTLALAITLAEMHGYWPEYARSVVENARAFASALWGQGIPVHGLEFGFTECHQVFIDVADLIEPELAARRLLAVGIRMNAIDIPQLGRWGLRAGLQELTRRGLDVSDAMSLAEIVAAAIRGDSDQSGLRRRCRSLAKQLAWQPLTTSIGGIHA